MASRYIHRVMVMPELQAYRGPRPSIQCTHQTAVGVTPPGPCSFARIT